MKSKKQYVFSIILFLFLLIGTYYFIFKDYSISTLLSSIENCNKYYILLSILGIVFYSIFASLYMKLMFKYFNKHISWYQAFGYLFTEVYFSAITPSSIGGQPVQMMEMKKDGLNYQINSIVVMLHTIIYKIVILVLATLACLFYFKDIFSQNKTFIILFILGYITTIMLIVVLLILVYSKKLVHKIIHLIINIGDKLHIIKDKNKQIEKLNDAIIGYHSCAKFTKDNPKVLIYSFIILLLQRISLISISYFVYRAFNLNALSYLEILAFQVCIIVACDFVPTPGSVAVSEGLLIEINKFIYGEQIAASAMILYRSISFYLFVIFCGIYYLIFHFTKRKKVS
jgi:hypothetical protein